MIVGSKTDRNERKKAIKWANKNIGWLLSQWSSIQKISESVISMFLRNNSIVKTLTDLR